MSNSSAPAITDSDVRGEVWKAGIWLLIIGTIGAIFMTWFVYSTLASYKLATPALTWVTPAARPTVNAAVRS